MNDNQSYYEDYTKEEIDEICARLQMQLIARHPRVLDDPQIRWFYQKRILSWPIRFVKRLIGKIKR